MGHFYTIKCKKCGKEQEILIDVEGSSKEYAHIIMNTYYCRDCGNLSTIDVLNEEIACKKCKSKNITKDKSEYRCKKCGEKSFETIEEGET